MRLQNLLPVGPTTKVVAGPIAVGGRSIPLQAGACLAVLGPGRGQKKLPTVGGQVLEQGRLPGLGRDEHQAVGLATPRGRPAGRRGQHAAALAPGLDENLSFGVEGELGVTAAVPCPVVEVPTAAWRLHTGQLARHARQFGLDQRQPVQVGRLGLEVEDLQAAGDGAAEDADASGGGWTKPLL